MKYKQLVASILTLALFVSTPAGAVASEQSILLPGYKYPTVWTSDPYWEGVTAVGSSGVPLVVINPSNGPGTAVNSDYQAQIAENAAAGIRQIGYVHTSYQTRALSDVTTDIDQWHALYPQISGIFLDEIATTDDTLCYLSQAYNYIKRYHPDDVVIANPGVHITDAMAPYADIFVTTEVSSADYLNNYTAPTSAFEQDAANAGRIMHIVHGVDQADMAAVVAAARDRNAGWLFVTDDTMPNPYDALPTYFTELVTEVDTLPATQVVARGQQLAPAGCVDPNAYVAPVSDQEIAPPTPSPRDSTTPGEQATTAPEETTLAATGDAIGVVLMGGVALCAAAGIVFRLPRR